MSARASRDVRACSQHTYWIQAKSASHVQPRSKLAFVVKSSRPPLHASAGSSLASSSSSSSSTTIILCTWTRNQTRTDLSRIREAPYVHLPRQPLASLSGSRAAVVQTPLPPLLPLLLPSVPAQSLAGRHKRTLASNLCPRSAFIAPRRRVPPSSARRGKVAPSAAAAATAGVGAGVKGAGCKPRALPSHGAVPSPSLGAV
jgi:hypothetical protein